MTIVDCIKDLVSGSASGGLRDFIIRVFIGAFLAITFLQSGLDKVFDRKGNLDWMKGHFGKTFMKNSIPFLLTFITVMELCVGILNGVGVIGSFFMDTQVMLFWGAIIAAKTLLYLFFGQRVAKDYDGARTIVVYFIVALMGVLI